MQTGFQEEFMELERRHNSDLQKEKKGRAKAESDMEQVSRQLSREKLEKTEIAERLAEMGKCPEKGTPASDVTTSCTSCQNLRLTVDTLERENIDLKERVVFLEGKVPPEGVPPKMSMGKVPRKGYPRQTRVRENTRTILRRLV